MFIRCETTNWIGEQQQKYKFVKGIQRFWVLQQNNNIKLVHQTKLIILNESKYVKYYISIDFHSNFVFKYMCVMSEWLIARRFVECLLRKLFNWFVIFFGLNWSINEFIVWHLGWSEGMNEPRIEEKVIEKS